MKKRNLTPSYHLRPSSRTLVLLLMLVAIRPLAQAQTFWQTTATAPYGPKLGLAATGDSTLITRVGAGVLRTTNRGRSWALALRSRNTYTLHASPSGRLLVGGMGKIYRSPDAGTSWDSVALATPYPVVAIAETPQGGLLIGTGSTDQAGFLGDGVFYSGDNGLTWTARSTGFGAARYVGHLAVDRQGRIYAAVSDDEGSRQPGLYRSLNNGLTWQHLPIRINGRNVIDDQITVHEALNLSVSPQDSLLLSFSGVAVNVGVNLNLTKSLNDVANPAQAWEVQGRRVGMWWNQTEQQRVHFARNGDWYSSRFGSVNSGGTMQSRDQGRNWSLIRSGLGLSVSGLREPQSFAELPDGQLFMVQDLDEQVYWTNASRLPSAMTRPQVKELVQLFPNPASTAVQLRNLSSQTIRSLVLMDLRGRHVRTLTVSPGLSSQTIALDAEKAGVYLLRIALADGQVVQQRLVKQE